MSIGMENPLLLMGGDFELYCLQQKSCGNSQNFNAFPNGMTVQCSFPMGIIFQGIYLTGDKFLAVRVGNFSRFKAQFKSGVSKDFARTQNQLATTFYGCICICLSHVT